MLRQWIPRVRSRRVRNASVEEDAVRAAEVTRNKTIRLGLAKPLPDRAMLSSIARFFFATNPAKEQMRSGFSFANSFCALCAFLWLIWLVQRGFICGASYLGLSF